MLKKILSFSEKKSKDQLELIRFIISRFGYRPKNLAYFKIACTHKSVLSNDTKIESNERLEFLGDSILGSVIAEWLYSRFPDEDEGYLTQLKSKIVSRKILSEVAEKLELRKIIHYQKGRSMNISSIEGNTLEAIFGAIYLDGGFQAVKSSIVHHIFRKYIDVSKLLTEELDFKSKLIILCQRNKWTLNYLIESEDSTDTLHHYTIVVEINKVKYSKGVAGTKKEAEQLASKSTLEELEKLY